MATDFYILTITPADDWFAVFDLDGEEIRASVAFWEIEGEYSKDGPNTYYRRAMVYRVGSGTLANAFDDPNFLRLEYEPELDVTRVVQIEELEKWLTDHGATDKDIKTWRLNHVSQMVAKRLAEDEFEELTDRTEV